MKLIVVKSVFLPLALMALATLRRSTAILQHSGALPKVQLRQKETGERTYVDPSGRELFFHGFNAVVKGPPWIPETNYWDGNVSLVEKDFKDLQSIGQNVVRLGSMWPGAEPADGKFDAEYISRLKLIVRTAAEYGIYVLLDMHQDVLSEQFCGEGAPDWLIELSKGESNLPTFPAPMNDNESYTATAADGYPLRSDCSKSNWPSYYGTYDCSRAFEALYCSPEDCTGSSNSSDRSSSSSSNSGGISDGSSSIRGVRDRWARFWSTIAGEFKDESSVLGYELINEPWPGDVFEQPSLLIPGVADAKKLQPAYDEVSAAIRAVDTTTLIFFAAITWDDIIPAGFTAAPGGESMADRSVFAYHYYEPPQELQATYFHTRVADARRLHVGSMVTEFERPENSDDFTEEGDPFFTTAAAMDKHLQSWIMWELKTFCRESDKSLASNSQSAQYGACKTGFGSQDWLWDSTGELNINTSKKLARSYATAVAGNTSSMSFDHTSGRFQLTYSIDCECKLPTVIFAHQQLHYSSGMRVITLPHGQLSVDVIQQLNTIEVRPLEGSTLVSGDEVTVLLERM